eukprot:CAMPEP_0114152160 /NCGR_PEP_ID=MMETSP0043_2-20121206/23648_1 /TAXON_ID=464988 /ORGANISM="Hemiselmis andersenii, Strain CCMP644" /LENGTH=190 /DNA_ID=CAMNT_0001247059 /DNA_START=84 /DNA_END=656 /DNA_ORIENTATION=+
MSVLYNGVADIRRCSLGGTGRDFSVDMSQPAVAWVACDVDGNGNLAMSESLVEDCGWHGGAGLHFGQEATGLLRDCRIVRCRTAVFLAHFCNVSLQGCVLKHNVHGAFVSMCYWMPSETPEGYEEQVWEEVYGEGGTGVFSPGEGLTNEELLQSGKGGTLKLVGNTVQGKAWADENRPVFYEHDGGAELD